MYSHIMEISNILGIELCNAPLLYEYKITTLNGNVIDSVIHHKIHKIKDMITYTLETTERTTKIVELKTMKQVNDIFCNFIRDSYYDSPILFNNLKKIEDDEFIDFYKKKPSYFYMGLYKNDSSRDLYRVYVRRNKEE